jgi:hypothetical protein
MASTYVNDLRLNEMATGDASGSWGTVTNTNLELIGEAFSYGTETIGDADSTLTIADGAADAARSFYLKITSSVDLTTTRIVTLGPNTVSKVWMIENATTGSQVITIKQGSGATINVPNGQVKMISTDGAGSGGAVLDLLVDVDLTGTTTLVNLDVSGAVDIAGDLTLSAGGDGALRFTAASSVKVLDNNAAALVFEEADNAYMTFVTTDGSEAVKFDKALDINAATQIDATVTVGVDDTGYDVKFFGATTGKSLLWDESADSLIVTGTTTLVGTTNLDAVDIDGATQIDATVTVGVDDTGYDVKFFGATAGAYMLWDESADTLEVSGTVVADGLTVDGGNTIRLNAASGDDFLTIDQGAADATITANSAAGNANLVLSTTASGAVKERVDIAYNGDISFYEDTGTTAKFYWDSSAEALGIGTTSPSTKLDVLGSINSGVRVSDGTTTGIFYASGEATNSIVVGTTTNHPLILYTNNAARVTIDSTGDVGIGTSSPESRLSVLQSAVDGNALVLPMASGATDENFTSIRGKYSVGNEYCRGEVRFGVESFAIGSGFLAFATGTNTATERMRIDSSGNVLVGTTDNSVYNNGTNTSADTGINLNTTYAGFARYNGIPMYVNRTGSDGDILAFNKSGATVGSIGVGGGSFYIGQGDTGLGFFATDNIVFPADASAHTERDNAIDLGYATGRFDDIYATNGTIQTSDRNEKQDIDVMSEAETRVAVACKGLIRKFRWIDAVAEKGDDARIHFGIIAQDLQDAFAAEGLDAGRYAMFISSTWWETQTDVPAVEAVAEVLDEEGNVVTEAVEAKEAYIRTDTFMTLEEAPEGATERTRLGVRYPELLAFIIGAL